MAKIKFKKLSTISLFSLAFLTPLAVSSCSDMPTGQINKPSQVEELKTDSAKVAILDSWLSRTFSSLMAKKIVNNQNDNVKEMKVTNTILYYLDYLKFPDSSSKQQLLDGSQVDVVAKSEFTNEFDTLEKEIKNAFKFYISFKSTIGDADNATPSLYFIKKSIEWTKEKYETSSAADGKKIYDFKPEINYGKDGNFTDEEFKILMATRGTKIFQDILKMMLTKIYFLDNDEQMIKNGTNFNKMINEKFSLNYYNTLALVEGNGNSTANNYKNYMFKKYLIDNSPSFQWSYTSEDYSNKTTLESKISTLRQFNNLKSTKEASLNEIIAPASNETNANSLITLQAFNSLLNSSSEDNTNDLSNDIEVIKTYGYTKQGLLNNDNKTLMSFSDFETIKKAIEYNKTNTTKLAIPSINIKDSSRNSNVTQIDISSIEVKWNSGTTTSKGDGVFENGNQKMTINSVSFEPTKDEQKIVVSFTYEFDGNKLNYSFNILNWKSDGTNETNPFKNEYQFTGDSNQVGINIFDKDGNSTGITYYLRILPIFERVSTRAIGSESKNYLIGNFTFKNTPWDNEENQTKLAYFFSLTNSDLYTQIQNFYLFNNFNIDNAISDLSIISELGLTKKTDNDRKQEGII